MKVKLSVIGLIASVALFAAFAGAQQQSDTGMQQSGQSGDQQQMQQKGAMMQDPQTIKQVQQALSDQGYYKGPADGKWGSKTESALKEFQQAKGMQATGQLDQQTLASLGVQGGAAAGGQKGGMQDQQSGAGGQQGGSKY